jgi:hypothetical protein
VTLATRLGELWRREASLSSIGNVRTLEEQREARMGASAGDLNARFAARVQSVEARVQALETEVLKDA